MGRSARRARSVGGTHADRGNGDRDLHLLASENESLLDGRDALLLFHLLLDLGDLVVGFNIELDLLARQGTNSFGSSNVSTVQMHALRIGR